MKIITGGHNSFYLRKSWLTKLFHKVFKQNINERIDKEFFSKSNIIELINTLGIGSNMVISLKYWIDVLEIFNKNRSLIELSEQSKVIFELDPYLENNNSLWLLHSNILTKEDEKVLIWDLVFSSELYPNFTKTSLEKQVEDFYKFNNLSFSSKTISDTIDVFIKTYLKDEKLKKNPEENIISQFSKLSYLEEKEGRYSIRRIKKDEISEYLIYYILYKTFKTKNLTDITIFKAYQKVNRVFKMDYQEFEQIIKLLEDRNEIERVEKNIRLDIERYTEKEIVRKALETDLTTCKKEIKFSIKDKTEIKKYIKESLNSIDNTMILNKSLKPDFYYPLKYNYEKDITRYLKQIFVDSNQMDYLFSNEEKSDGKIVYLINTTDFSSYERAKDLLKEKDIVVVTNKNSDKVEIDEILKEIEAIEYLILDEICLNNQSLKEEYLLYKEELLLSLKGIIKEYFSKSNIEASYRGKLFETSNLLEITYDYLNEKYKNYIGINYELMNKENLSVPMKKARQTLLEMLIKKDKILNEKEFYQNTGAINSVARTVLRKMIEITANNFSFIDSWEILERDIISEIKSNNYLVEELYKDYTSDKKGFGFRKGIFTLFIGSLLIKNKAIVSVVETNTKSRVNLTSELIENLEKNPENYYISYVEKTKDDEKYLTEIKELLGVYYLEGADIETDILEGIKNYFYSFNRFITGVILKECSLLSKIFNILFQERDTHEFLFKELLIRARVKTYDDVIKTLKNEIDFIEEAKIKFESKIKDVTLKVFGDFDSLEEGLKSYQSELKKLDNGIKIWLKKYEFKNERKFLQDMTTKIKGFSFENWSSERDIESYSEKLEKFLKIDSEKNEIRDVDVIEIFTGEDRIVVPVVDDYSQMGKLLKTKLLSTIKSMGLSIKEDEKKLILLDILKEI